MDYLIWLGGTLLQPVVDDTTKLAIIVFGLLCMAFAACIMWSVDAPKEFADYE